MTDTPTTPRKNAPGQGRKPKPDRRFLLPIRCTPEQYAAILARYTTEERALILFFNINDKGPLFSEYIVGTVENFAEE